MKSYILTLLAAAILVSMSSLLLPEGSVKKYAYLVSSVIISLSVIAPFKSVFNISEVFDFEEISYSEMSVEDAESIYSNTLKDEIKKNIEEELSDLGRVYVNVADDLKVNSIEIYTNTAVSEEEKELIKEFYNPERLEIKYGEY